MIKVPHNYSDCYLCGMDAVEMIVELEYRWKGRVYLTEGIPAGACQQCGEKYFTMQVSEPIDRSAGAKEIKKTISVPVKGYMPVGAI